MSAADEITRFKAQLRSGRRCAMSIVIGPDDEQMRASCAKLGGAWALAADLARRYKYVLACAYNRERITKRAPLIYACADLSTLRVVGRLACQQLDDIDCLWLVAPGTDAAAIVSEITLEDCTVQGRA